MAHFRSPLTGEQYGWLDRIYPSRLFVGCIALGTLTICVVLSVTRLEQEVTLVVSSELGNFVQIENDILCAVSRAAIEAPRHLLGAHGYLLEDDGWGQTCNKLQLIAGSSYKVKEDSSRARRNLFLTRHTSEVVPFLDIRALAADLTIYLNCTTSSSVVANGTRKPDRVNCAALVHKGVWYSVPSNSTFLVHKVLDPSDIFWTFGPSRLGLMQELRQDIRPHPVIMRRARGSLARLSDLKTVGIHRRTMDDLCYAWLGEPQEYDCYPDISFWLPDAMKISQLLTDKDKKPIRRTYKEWQTLESNHPFLMACNYTFTARQAKEILGTDCPSTFTALMATDGQDKLGDTALESSKTFSSIVRIDPGAVKEVEACVGHGSSQGSASILLDMAVLSLSDIHVGNPLSSCDIIVAHWRIGLRNDLQSLVNSSYPTACYNGFYLDALAKPT